MLVESWFYPLIAAVAGLLIGSFLNVCIYRVCRDVSVVHPRSFCPECGKSIAWYDNIPVLSFMLLKGGCRHCGQRISFRYPLVELSTAVLFAATVARFGWRLESLKWCLFEALMTVLFWVDLEERILPDEFTLGGVIAGLAFTWISKVPGDLAGLFWPAAGPHVRSLVEGLTGAIVLTVPIATLGFLWGKCIKRSALGLGDVKLLPCIGLFLGVELGVQVLLAGSLLGIIVGGTYILVMKKKAREYELPLGSFFCAAAAVAPFFVAQ